MNKKTIIWTDKWNFKKIIKHKLKYKTKLCTLRQYKNAN